ncbi:hypothetical protein IQ782_22435 [Salipiger pacificus]|uniref:Transposase n=2 Tax=Salipiger mangrovisoli TaxID=2865933 RepID=A0ABR9X7P8_9RHOB|nr:hypothetical protein [Salipiger mangrovisoli]
MTIYNTERPHSAPGLRTPVGAHQDPDIHAAEGSTGKLGSAADLSGKMRTTSEPLTKLRAAAGQARS